MLETPVKCCFKAVELAQADTSVVPASSAANLCNGGDH